MNKKDLYENGDPFLGEDPKSSRFYNERLRLNKELLRFVKGNKLLDVGCGRGYYANEFSKSFSVAGLDLSEKAIKFAKKKYPHIKFVISDCYYTCFPKDTFDVVVCNNIFEHLENPDKLLEEIFRILKHNKKGRGYFIVSTPNKYRLSNLINIILNKPLKKASKHHVKEYSFKEVKEHFEKNNFELLLVKCIHTRSENKTLESIIFNFVNIILSKLKLILFSSTIFYLTVVKNRNQL